MIDYSFLYSKPTNRAEFSELLKQAIRIGDELNNQLDDITRILEKEYSKETA